MGADRLDTLHVARVRDDLVILDLDSGAYELAAGAFADAPEGEARARVQRVLGTTAFATMGSLDDDPTGLARLRLQGLDPDASRPIKARDRIDFTRAWLDLGLTYPGRPLRALVSRAAPTGRWPADEIRRRAGVFSQLLPWAPFPGACLYRAYFLRLFLRRAGGDAAWVFGVRTWPFRAHCWLEADGVVLSDDPEAVRRYTPILRA